MTQTVCENLTKDYAHVTVVTGIKILYRFHLEMLPLLLLTRHKDKHTKKTEEVKCRGNVTTSHYIEVSYDYCFIIIQPHESQRACAVRQLN